MNQRPIPYNFHREDCQRFLYLPSPSGQTAIEYSLRGNNAEILETMSDYIDSVPDNLPIKEFLHLLIQIKLFSERLLQIFHQHCYLIISFLIFITTVKWNFRLNQLLV